MYRLSTEIFIHDQFLLHRSKIELRKLNILKNINNLKNDFFFGAVCISSVENVRMRSLSYSVVLGTWFACGSKTINTCIGQQFQTMLSGL